VSDHVAETMVDLHNQIVTNSFENADQPRHRWYAIKEGFSGRLISDAIEEFPNSRRAIQAIEPFAGSGTAPVEYAVQGIDCLAFEVNPFLAFVAEAKLTHASPSAFSRARPCIIRGLQTPIVSSLEIYSTFCKRAGNEKWLFNRSVLRAFAGGWRATENYPANLRRLFRLALLRAVMDNCNAYPDGKCLRYKRLKTYDCFGVESLISQFDSYCDIIVADLGYSPLPYDLGHILNMDSRGLSSFPLTSKFHICVTSPPYLNSFDYSDIYRPELFLGGFVKTNADLMRIRLQTVRSHLQANWTSPKRDSFGVLYATVLKELGDKRERLWNKRIPEMIQAYFEDIEAFLTALKVRAHKGAKLKIAIGTSAYAGVVIPVDLIIAEIAERVGWLLDDVAVVRRLRSSGQHWHHEQTKADVPELRESIVMLRSAF
jgi:uncharacterized membrane protein YkvA (DUF1232 family)